MADQSNGNQMTAQNYFLVIPGHFRTGNDPVLPEIPVIPEIPR